MWHKRRADKRQFRCSIKAQGAHLVSSDAEITCNLLVVQTKPRQCCDREGRIGAKLAVRRGIRSGSFSGRDFFVRHGQTFLEREWPLSAAPSGARGQGRAAKEPRSGRLKSESRFAGSRRLTVNPPVGCDGAQEQHMLRKATRQALPRHPHADKAQALDTAAIRSVAPSGPCFNDRGQCAGASWFSQSTGCRRRTGFHAAWHPSTQWSWASAPAIPSGPAPRSARAAAKRGAARAAPWATAGVPQRTARSPAPGWAAQPGARNTARTDAARFSGSGQVVLQGKGPEGGLDDHQ